MCGECYVSAGSPTDWTEQTGRLIDLIGELYTIHVTGGPLHTALDDWNLSGTITPYYECWSDDELDKLWCHGWEAADLAAANPSLGRPVTPLGRSTRSLCDEIAQLLNGMSEPERYAALAYADGLIKRPA